MWIILATFGHSAALLSSAIYFSATPPKAATQYKIAIFVNNNDYIFHSVHIELKLSAAAASAAF
jgi:hypothetical protein